MTSTPPEELHWLHQERQHPDTHDEADADPVQRVWQLPLFRLGSRRFIGQADHALVFITRKGTYETFRPPARPFSVRRYVALYEVNTDPHAFQLRVPLPSQVDSFEFEVTADITWRVLDPEAFVRSQERDVPGFVTRRLLPRMQTVSRDHPVEASAEAERAMQRVVDEASPVGQAQGLDVTCTVRLRRDADARSHQARLRTARHEAEAAGPEHEAALLREKYEAERQAEKIKFYENQLAQGGTTALALHLVAHPDETGSVLNHLKDEQREVVTHQLHLIDHVLNSEKLESFELEEPRRLIIERMTTILRGAADPTDDEPPPSPGLSDGSAPAGLPAPRLRKEQEPGE
ncbi:hypothetical protein [Streptomyces sp. NPDC051684]|uniref:hypothetical protein n=1 Tax=Streptomyces sp. NPDC051684 TaxID=3365670 RepID=UPI00378963DB